jgi:hypothetical protein
MKNLYRQRVFDHANITYLVEAGDRFRINIHGQVCAVEIRKVTRRANGFYVTYMQRPDYFTCTVRLKDFAKQFKQYWRLIKYKSSGAKEIKLKQLLRFTKSHRRYGAKS